MEQSERDIFIKNIFCKVAPYVDPLSTAFSFGLCNVWRRKLVSLSGIKKGDRVLDICTGTGELAVLLVDKVGPEGSLTGADFCEDMLSRAMGKIDPAVPNVAFVVSDAKDLVFPDKTFDVVTVSFGMRNIPDTASALREARRVLKPGGRFVCLELTQPEKSWFLPIYKWYIFRVIPFLGKIFTHSPDPYSYLPVSIEAYYPPEEFKRMIEECGFSNVKAYPLSMGIATIYRGDSHG